MKKIIINKINNLVSRGDKQERFELGRCSTDAVFTLRKIRSKSIEYNKFLYRYFIHLVKAFDRLQLRNMRHHLYYCRISHNQIETIENIYNENQMKPIKNQKRNSIPQVDWLSCLLSHIIMKSNKGSGQNDGIYDGRKQRLLSYVIQMTQTPTWFTLIARSVNMTISVPET